MIISIQQPEHWPWLGYFDKIRQVDEVVFFDNVQFKPRYFESRQKIRNYTSSQWIRIPVIGSSHRQMINEVMVDNVQNWRKDAWESIRINYQKAPFWKNYEEEVNAIYKKDWIKLVDFNVYVIKWLANKLGLVKKFYLASELNPEGRADDLLVSICLKVKADGYLSGRDGKNYIDKTKFDRAGLKLYFQDFHHPTYKQFHSGEFQIAMSTLDLIFNEGPNSRKILDEVPLSIQI